MTRDRWHVRCVTWHLTRDIRHVIYGRRWTFSHNFRSLAYTVWEWWCLEDLEEKGDLANQLMNHEGVCRTVPSALGLLSTFVINSFSESLIFSSQSSKQCLFQTVSARELKFWDNVHPPPCVTCHMSRVPCHVSRVTCNVSRVMWHV